MNTLTAAMGRFRSVVTDGSQPITALRKGLFSADSVEKVGGSF